ncbi:MAG: proline dehydrogenase family protein [Planctomycetota bacterium]
MGLLDRIALSTLPLVPTPLMRKLASRYIAGERLDQAIERLAALGCEDHPGILDILGEGITSEAEAREVARDYRAAAAKLRGTKIDAYVSVKPTHVGLSISEDLAYELYAEIASEIEPHGQFVRVEMEDHPTTDGTLRVFKKLRERFDNVGIVLQSRLFRTLDDIRAMPDVPLNVRLVKGIYLEPAEIAHTEAEPIRRAYVECAKLLLDRPGFTAFATHDDGLAERCLAEVRERGLSKERYEFQVLLGVREALWEHWKSAGHTVRVYVPYGPQWRAYSQRRLRKNPNIFRHVLKDTLLPRKKTEFKPC